MLKRIDHSLALSIKAMSGKQTASAAATKLAIVLGVVGLLIALASIAVPDTAMLGRRRGAAIPVDWALWVAAVVFILFGLRAFMIRGQVDA